MHNSSTFEVPAPIAARIHDEIARIEAENEVRVLYACESGSRAWGFASPDSDWDARFLYIRPTNWYLSINVETRRDVIERPIVDELDLNGWDIRKALGLLYKSNPPLLEWLGSPIEYLNRFDCHAMLQEAVEQCFSPIACAYHYKQMARRNYEAYLRGQSVRLKKYLYVLRPLLAVRWIEAGRGIVPTAFAPVLESELPLNEHSAARSDVDQLLRLKMAGGELSEGPRLKYLHAWIEGELERLSHKQFDLEAGQKRGLDLGNIFRELLRRTWSE